RSFPMMTTATWHSSSSLFAWPDRDGVDSCDTNRCTGRRRLSDTGRSARGTYVSVPFAGKSPLFLPQGNSRAHRPEVACCLSTRREYIFDRAAIRMICAILRGEAEARIGRTRLAEPRDLAAMTARTAKPPNHDRTRSPQRNSVRHFGIRLERAAA